MEWSIRKQADGVITDDPKLFLEACERHTVGGDGSGGGRLSEKRKRSGVLRMVNLYASAFCLQVVTVVLLALFSRKLTALGRRKEIRL